MKITPSPGTDDDRTTMTIGERTTWCEGILVILAVIAYFAIVLPELAITPASDIAWQAPMLVAVGVVIVGTIAGSIVSSIAAAIISRDPNQETDIRDKQIDIHGERSSLAVTGLGIAAVLGLAMFEVDQFWIGSALFATGATGAIWGSVVKIRAYRLSFRG